MKAEAWLERMSMNAKKQELLRAVRLPKLYRADADSILQMSCPDVTSLLEQNELKEGARRRPPSLVECRERAWCLSP